MELGADRVWLLKHRRVGQLIPVLSSYLRLIPYDRSDWCCTLQHILHRGAAVRSSQQSEEGRREGSQASLTDVWELRLCKKKSQKMSAAGAGRAGTGCTTAQVCTVSSPIFLQRDEVVAHRPPFWCSAVCLCSVKLESQHPK